MEAPTMTTSPRSIHLGICLATALAATAVTRPAHAIVFGEPDGDRHPSVGSIVIDVPPRGTFPGALIQLCTGTLISEDVFLTASHCLHGMDEYLARFPAGTRVVVTFDPTIARGGTFYTGSLFANPLYNPELRQMGDTQDIAVIVLDEAPGIQPARLPPAGLLDDLKAQHTLDDIRFTAVGYGAVRETMQGAFDTILLTDDRNRAEQSALSLTDGWLTLAMTQPNGNGGTCYGDSGGPHFVHLDGVETDIIASTTIIGDYICKATDKTFRLDSASARAFLAGFVDLP
jgi:hypothetical protein